MKKNCFLFFVLFSLPLVYGQELLSLHDVISEALQNNYGIRIEKERVVISENEVTRGNAGFLPQVNLTGSFTKSVSNADQEYVSGQVINKTDAKSDSWNAGLAINWTLFDGFDMFITYERLQTLQEVERLRLSQQMEQLAVSVMRSYYTIVLLRQQREVIDSTISVSVNRVRMLQDKVTYGAASELELMQAIVDMHADSSALLQQELLIEREQIQLNKIIGRNEIRSVTPADPITLSPVPSFRDLEETALAENKGLQLVKTQKSIKEFDTEKVRSEFYPELSLFGNYNYTHATSESGLLRSNITNGFNLGATVSLNIFNGLNTQRKLENAQIEEKIAVLSISETEQNLRSSLRAVFAEYEKNRNLIAFEEKNFTIAGEVVKIAYATYSLGAATALEFREAQRNFVQAHMRLLQANYNAKLTEIELLLLTGRLLQ